MEILLHVLRDTVLTKKKEILFMLLLRALMKLYTYQSIYSYLVLTEEY